MDGEQNQNQGNLGGQQNSTNQAPNLDVNNNSTLIAALSYIGPLVVVSYLMSKDSDFVKFHAKQGLVVFGIEVIWIILSQMFYLYNFNMIVNLATLILSIMGIVYVVQGQKKELPLVGGLAKNFNF